MSDKNTIADATLVDASEVGRLLGEAFAEDPVANFLLRGQNRSRRLFELMFRCVYSPLGGNPRLLAQDQNTLACALWAPAEKSHRLSAQAKWRIGLHLASFVDPMILLNFARYDAFVCMHEPEVPHHYIHAIGVRPDHQGRGLGQQLLDVVLQRADQNPAPVYLENSNERNIRLYERNGFEVVSEEITPGGGPPVWFMLRTAT